MTEDISKWQYQRTPKSGHVSEVDARILMTDLAFLRPVNTIFLHQECNGEDLQVIENYDQQVYLQDYGT